MDTKKSQNKKAILSFKETGFPVKMGEETVTIREVGKQYLQFINPEFKSPSVKTTDSSSLVVKSKLR